MGETSNGRDLLDLAARWRANSVFDETFEENVRQAREAASADLDADPWLD